MAYARLLSRFGGMNTRLHPTKLPPGMATAAYNVDLTGGILQARLGDEEIAALNATAYNCIYAWGDNRVGSTERYSFAEYGGRLLRANYRPDASKAVPQYTTATKYAAGYWDALGIKAPAVAPTAAAGAAGTPNGTYSFYVTFITDDGDESPPSPAGTVTVANQRVDLSAIPIGYGQGTTTNGQPTVTAVANIASFRVGMRITAPAGIPAGTYITAINTGTSTITMSANATATGSRELQDAQVTARRIYRTGGTIAATKLVTTLANVTATTYTDNAADTALTSTLRTTGYDVLPVVGGFTVAPNGAVVGIAAGAATGTGTAIWHTEVSTIVGGLFGLSKSTYFLTTPQEVAKVFYALDVLCVFGEVGAYTITGARPADYALTKADGDMPAVCYYPVAMDGAVLVADSPGVMAFDGQALKNITVDVFSDANNAAWFVNAAVLGAARCGNRYFVMTSGLQQSDPDLTYNNYTIFEFNPAILGGWVGHTCPGGSETGQALCYSNASNEDAILVACNGGVWKFASNTSELFGYLQWGSGALELPDDVTSLRTLRGAIIEGIGPWYAGVYVVGVDGSTGAIDNYTPATPGQLVRRRARASSGSKGRYVTAAVGMVAAVAGGTPTQVHEIGVLIGEKKRNNR